jgi:hypothetical protein
MSYQKQPWEMTLQEYADSIYNNPEEQYLCKENNIKELKEYRQTLEDLLAKKIKPSKVIGTGYKNPRKVAITWLEQRIRDYKAIVDGTKIHSVIKANYECYIRAAIREGKVPPIHQLSNYLYH